MASGFGFRQAARATGLDISSLWRIEHGVFTPTLVTISRLVSAYGANLNVAPDGLMLTWMEEEDWGFDDDPQKEGA